MGIDDDFTSDLPNKIGVGTGRLLPNNFCRGAGEQRRRDQPIGRPEPQGDQHRNSVKHS